MMLAQFELLDAGPVQLRFSLADGAFFREVRVPGADLSDLPAEARSAIVNHWTSDRIAAWQSAREAVESGLDQFAPEPSEMVNEEVARRTDAGFVFLGTLFQARPGDLLKITGAVAAASIAVAGGAQAGDLRWQSPDVDFAWIATDNTSVTMDAPTMIAFGQAAMAHVSALVWAGRAIKDRLLAGEAVDISEDAHWVLTAQI